MRDVNACRMYLKVTMVSDIASGDGRRVLTSVYRVSSMVIGQGECIKYPVQPNPPREVWNTWRKVMGLIAT